jgi:LPXTG-motif cell wall-anchored protein
MNFHPTALSTLIAVAIILGAAIYLVRKKK